MYNFKSYSYCLLMILATSVLHSHAQDRKPMDKVADEHYYRFEYKQAALIYETLIKKDKSQTALLKKLSHSYQQMNDYEKAAGWYKVIVSTPEVTPDDMVTYGDLLKNLGDYKAAKDVYNRHSQKGLLMVSQRIASCDSAMKWLDHPTAGRVSNLSALNTSSSDWGAVVNKQKKLIFISDSLRMSGFARILSKKDKAMYQRVNRPYLKLYQYNGYANPADGSIVEFSALLNNFDYHVGPLIFDQDDSMVYFTVTSAGAISKRKDDVLNFYGNRRLEIFSSKLQNGSWTKPVPFAFNSDQFSVGHPALSADGNIMYFSSDMPGGQGKTDIWYCERLPNGSWGVPVNCGPEINTAEDEEFPTINKDLLYFSSKGHMGMGGFDIFSAAGNKSTWSTPQNLKSPVNSPRDDFFLSMQDDENGYFSSNRAGGKGDDDIYTYYLKKELPVVVAKVDVVDVKPVEPPKIAVPRPAPAAVAVGRKFVVYYDFNKSDIRGDASKTLDELVNLMEKFPAVRVLLVSYTDPRGKDGYNMALSKKRANSAMDYLIANGVVPDRIITKGNGVAKTSKQCLNDKACLEKQRQLSRRTEVVIYSN